LARRFIRSQSRRWRLAAAPKREAPVPDRLGAELDDRVAVARHRVVVAVPAHDAGEPAYLVGDRERAASHQFGLDLPELRGHPLLASDALEREMPVPGLRAYMREAKDSNVSGFPSTRCFRRSTANLPNSISRVLSGCSSGPNFANLSRRSARIRSASCGARSPRSSRRRTSAMLDPGHGDRQQLADLVATEPPARPRCSSSSRHRQPTHASG
jgi:hypothetical protein